MASRGSIDIKGGIGDGEAFDFQIVFVTKTYVQSTPGRNMFTWFEHDAATPGVLPGTSACTSLTFANKHNLAEADFNIIVNGVSVFTWEVRDARTACENFSINAPAFVMNAGDQIVMKGIDPNTAGKQRAEDVTVLCFFAFTEDFVLGYQAHPTLLP